MGIPVVIAHIWKYAVLLSWTSQTFKLQLWNKYKTISPAHYLRILRHIQSWGRQTFILHPIYTSNWGFALAHLPSWTALMLFCVNAWDEGGYRHDTGLEPRVSQGAHRQDLQRGNLKSTPLHFFPFFHLYRKGTSFCFGTPSSIKKTSFQG